MSTINNVRTGIKAAIAGISALSSVTVYDSVLPTLAVEVAVRKPGIVLSYVGRRKIEQSLSTRVDVKMAYRWNLTTVVENYRTPDGAVQQTLGLEEIAEALDGIRTVKLCTIAGEDVYLTFVDESLSAPPDRAAMGGPAALVQTWETTEVLL